MTLPDSKTVPAYLYLGRRSGFTVIYGIATPVKTPLMGVWQHGAGSGRSSAAGLKQLEAVVSRARGSRRSSHALHAGIARSGIPCGHLLASRSGRISAIPIRPPTSMMTPQIMNPVLNPASGVVARSTTLPIT